MLRRVTELPAEVIDLPTHGIILGEHFSLSSRLGCALACPTCYPSLETLGVSLVSAVCPPCILRPRTPVSGAGGEMRREVTDKTGK